MQLQIRMGKICGCAWSSLFNNVFLLPRPGHLNTETVEINEDEDYVDIDNIICFILNTKNWTLVD